MTRKKAASKNGKHAGEAPASFTLDEKHLPPKDEAAALSSGNFPYDVKLSDKKYRRELKALQIELVKLQNWVKKHGERIVLVFEGRDAAGKGGAIQRFTEHLNPRGAQIVALPKPSPRESGQWYFQRYICNLPGSGEIVIFDRSWYNRAAVEPVFGFCTPEQSEQFLREVPQFEAMLARDGIHVFKFFLTIGREMQMKRLLKRANDPLERWKISPIDEKAIEKWDAYSSAFDRMLAESDSATAPWTVIRANDKRRARLEVIRHVLLALSYANRDAKIIGKADSSIALSSATFLGAGGEK